MREIVYVEPSSRNEEAQTEYKIEEQVLFRIQTAWGLSKKKHHKIISLDVKLVVLCVCKRLKS